MSPGSKLTGICLGILCLLTALWCATKLDEHPLFLFLLMWNSLGASVVAYTLIRRW